MELLKAKKGFICDMDGVIYHGNKLVDGVKDFVEWLNKNEKRYLFLTNGSGKSPKELSKKLARMGLNIGEEHFYTSAQATANFVAMQSPGASAFVIGEPGLIGALYNAGITYNDVDPEYVIVGETANYNYDYICKAMRLVMNGAKLIATNPDMTYPDQSGIAPACKALVAPIEATTGKQAYYIGKPNPVMMRTAIRILETRSRETAMIGDRMDTDIIAGIESGLDPILVLSGVSTRESVDEYPYRPRLIINNVGDIAK